MKTKAIGYWATTAILAFVLLSGGAAQDGVGHLVWPLFFAACGVASWALRPPSRTLGSLFPARGL